jgi:hypothetical protein
MIVTVNQVLIPISITMSISVIPNGSSPHSHSRPSITLRGSTHGTNQHHSLKTMFTSNLSPTLAPTPFPASTQPPTPSPTLSVSVSSRDCTTDTHPCLIGSRLLSLLGLLQLSRLFRSPFSRQPHCQVQVWLQLLRREGSMAMMPRSIESWI